MTNKIYDTLKFIATLLLPALGTLYFAIAQIWNLPYGEEIVGTIVAVTTFLCSILKISSVNYSKTHRWIKTDDGLYCCENCGNYELKAREYCPSCGVRMETIDYPIAGVTAKEATERLNKAFSEIYNDNHIETTSD